MVRRPVSAAALFLGLILYVLTSLCPEMFIPSSNVPFNQKTEAQGRVCGIENKKTNTYVFLEQVSIGGQSSGKTLVIMSTESAEGLKLGNPVRITGRREEFSVARNKGNFDEKTYYRSLGYFNRFSAESITVTGSGFYPVGEAMRQLKIRITEAIDRIIVENGFTETNISGVFKAVVTGDKSGLDEDTKDLYQRNGIAHILAVSGLHISTLGLILFKFLRKYFSVVISASVSGLVMSLFAVMCGGSVSAVRASVMFVIMMGGYIFRRRYDMLTALGAAGIMLLLVNPFYVQNQGFVLSFSAIMGIGLLAGPINEFLSVKSKILSAFIASASVTLFTLPWIISSYYEIPLYSILLNMLVVPLMSSVLGCGLFSGTVGLMSVAAGRFFIGIGVFILYYYELLCNLTMKLPLNSLTVGAPDPLKIVIYYAVLLTAPFALKIIKRHRTHGLRSEKVPKIRYVFIAFIWVVSFLILAVPGKSDELTISFIDTGQGLCVFLKEPSGTTCLIDGGSSDVKDVYRYRMESAVKYMGTGYVDYCIITHTDGDHISGIIEMINAETVKIGELLVHREEGDEKYEELKSLCTEHNIKMSEWEAGREISGDVRLRCIYPAKGQTAENNNDISTVTLLEYNGFTAIFTGDIEQKTEKLITETGLLTSEVNLLQVPHHGSRSSSSEQFLEVLSPEISVISAGVNNSYGHPHEETLEKLKAAGSDIYITAEQGQITVSVHNDGSINIGTMF